MNTEKPQKRMMEKPFTFKDINEAVNSRVEKISTEMRDGFDFIKDCEKTVTFFGSARTEENEEDYIQTRSLAGKIATELDYTVVTGGSGGIMEAANRGAFEKGGKSIGLNIELPMEQNSNPYTTKEMTFHYFFTRKVSLAFSAEAYVFSPGGFGTMDELFEILTLIQTNKVEKVPVILLGTKFWNKLDAFVKDTLLENGKISPEDIDLYHITDDEEEIIEIIKKAPIRTGIE